MEDQDLDQYLTEEAAAVDAAPVAPVAAEQGYLSGDQRKALAQKLYNEAMSNDPTPPELADVESRMSAGSAPDMRRNPLVGLGQALAQSSKSRNDVIQNASNLSLATKLDAARSAGLAGALGGLADSVMDKKRSDAEAQLNADAKRAQMFRALHPKGSGAATLGSILNIDQRERQIGENNARYEAKSAAEAQKADPNSEASKSYREAMYRAGAPAGTLDGLSMNDMAAARTFNMQTTRLDAMGSEKDRALQNELYAAEEKRRAQQATDIMDERRKLDREQQAVQIPGMVTIKPVTEQAYKESLPLASAHRVLVNGNRELAEIQKKLELNRGILGGATGEFQAWLGSDEAKQLLARAKQLHTGKVNATRVLENFGVPQEFELKLINAMNPEAGSLSGFFKGPANWEESAKFADERLRGMLKDRGYMFPDDPGVYSKPEDAPVDSQVLKVDRQFTPYRPRGAGAKKEALPEVPPVSEKLPSASAKTQKYSVTVNGETVERPWTPEQLRAFLKNANERAKKDPSFKFEVTGVK
jgi:hypothetical protein